MSLLETIQLLDAPYVVWLYPDEVEDSPPGDLCGAYFDPVFGGHYMAGLRVVKVRRRPAVPEWFSLLEIDACLAAVGA